MKTQATGDKANLFIILAGPAVSLAATPFLTFDVLNPPKLLALVTFGGMALGTLISNRHKMPDKLYRPVFLVSLFFLLSNTSSFLFSGSNWITELYGVHGRHTGLLAYFSLCIIFLSIAVNTSLASIRFMVKAFFVTGFISYFYGYLQVFKLDPLPWKGNETWVVGTFGNPNFFSSFIAFTIILTFAYISETSTAKNLRLYGLVFFLLGLKLLVQIGSTQGFIVLAAGFSLVILVKVQLSTKFSKFFYPSLVLAIIGFSLAILDILQKAPWTSKLYKMSVSARGDFWQAAVKIIRDKPWTGVGIDQFRNWYPVYRDLNSLTHGESLSLTDSSHNVFLDFGVNGGIFLFLAYISLVLLTLVSSLRLIRRMRSFQPEVVGLIAVWLGYQAQSLVSINQLGIAVWGWIISGLIIGLEISSRPTNGLVSSPQASNISKKNNLKRSRSYSKNGIWMNPLFVGLIGFSLIWPLMSAHINYNSAMKTANPLLLLKAANQYPKDALRMSMAAESVSLMGYPRDGYELAKSASDFDPKFSIPWKIMATFPRVSEDEKKHIQDKLKELDPFFAETEKRRLALK